MLNAGRTSLFRWSAAVALTVGGLVTTPGAQQASNEDHASGNPHNALVTAYCLSCHNSVTKSGDLDLAAVNAAKVDEYRDVWEKVARKLNVGPVASVNVSPKGV